MEQVILVDSEDNELGLKEKMETHRNPVPLHRAFSVFVLNDKDQLLLTKRSSEKKTWPSFWSNTCCSHPRNAEPVELAGQRRLREELGFECDLTFLFKFEYSAKFNEEWGENELDHVLIGYYNGTVKPNENEIDEIKWMDLDELRADMEKNPNNYTPWLKLCFRRFLYHIGKT
ncbi:MAG: isopentenyl-diphosphate Delta-isomerase [Candidatus Aenigmarchaeota archaeon]|nr:isopentenyl-diphosphate Delta-isomerase [Candidatus Aenigmarchaeota archaeon]